MELQENGYRSRSLLAMPVGIKQKRNVNAIVQKVIHFLFLILMLLSNEILYLISLNSVSSREFYYYSIPL